MVTFVTTSYKLFITLWKPKIANAKEQDLMDA